ncbi:hypothetical protein M9H77_22404 [Catharanthus roseus]|uniref:Uncharacterized protein n=1 Tax=Catharanthus roseus TaxID=4058 RepID=A0ACC0AR32_CATRO|nr:hypothetical protein M9H77_22404 [Catharanthus roseus]
MATELHKLLHNLVQRGILNLQPPCYALGHQPVGFEQNEGDFEIKEFHFDDKKIKEVKDDVWNSNSIEGNGTVLDEWEEKEDKGGEGDGEKKSVGEGGNVLIP